MVWNSISALDPKSHGDWCQNGHAKRRKSGKNTKINHKTRFFLQKGPTFETSCWILTSNRFFWPEPTYSDIKFVLKCLPAHCGHHLNIFWVSNGDNQMTSCWNVDDRLVNILWPIGDRLVTTGWPLVDYLLTTWLPIWYHLVTLF